MPWEDAVLATDADLAKWESRMPDLAKAIVGQGGKTCYDGKRELAKERIAALLTRRGMNVDGLSEPSELNTAAVFMELHLMFNDMALRNDNVSADKAAYYLQQFQNEMDGIPLTYEDPGTSDPTTSVFGLIPIRRG